MDEIGLSAHKADINLSKEDQDVEMNDTVQLATDEEDSYKRLKKLQRQMKFLSIQEEYIKDEQKNLKRGILRAQEEVKRIQSVPLVLGQFLEMIDENHAIIGSTTGSNYYVRVLSTLNREELKPSSSVALHKHSNSIVDILPPESDASIQLLTASEKPDVHMRRLVDSIYRSKRFVKLLNYRLLILIFISKLVLILLAVFYCMGLREWVRLCWPKLLPRIPTPHLFVLLVLSLFKNIWERDHVWFVMSSV